MSAGFYFWRNIMTHTLTQLHDTNHESFITCLSTEELVAFTHSPLEEIFANLVEDMRNEQHLLHPSSEALQSSFCNNLGCIVLEKNGVNFSVVGFCRLIPLTSDVYGDWYEFGSVFINKSVRNKGVSTAMYKDFLSSHSDKLILATTTNPTAIAVGRKVNFTIVPRKSLPEEVWQASCTCGSEKTKSLTPSTCSLAHTESVCSQPCYFRITKETSIALSTKKISAS